MNKVNKIILGIDPGTARMGYGIIKYKNNELLNIEHGVLETKAGLPDHMRLKDLYNALEKLIKKHDPHAIAIEDIFYFKNKKTLISVSQARGIALLVAANYGKQCYSFTPLQVKQAVTGYGQADKKQVQIMVKTLLKLKEEPKLDDASDALAVAICCAHSIDILQHIQ